MDVTIAILTFKRFSPDSSFDLLMDGMREDLVMHLSKFTGLSVISPESTRELKGFDDVVTIEKLGITYLLSGSFRIIREQIRISIQLVRVEDSKIIFATEYNEPRQTVFDVMDDLVHQIVNIIQQQIDFDLLSFSYKKEKVDLAAYEHYLRGINALQKGSVEHDLQARKYFEAALEIDPAYARAYTGLSLSYFNEWSCQLWDRWDVSQNGAHENALKALELDENDYTALAVAGRTCLYIEEYERAEHYLRKSIRINPNDAMNLIQVAFSLMYVGKVNESVKLYQKACRLNPLHSDDYFAYGSNIYFEAGDYARAIELGSRLNPEDLWVDFAAYTAAAYFQLKDFEKMEEQWNIYLGLHADRILNASETNEKKALEWQIMVNPFQSKTNLTPFHNYIAERLGQPLPERTKEETTSRQASCILKGDMWDISFSNEQVLIKNNKGMNDIMSLLNAPLEEIHCTELYGTGLEEAGVEIIDQQAKSNYRSRIMELEQDLRDAEMLSNSQKIAELQEEYEQLVDHISSAIGIRDSTRKVSSSADKARSAVTLRIRSAIKKLEKSHLPLARHLHASIKTGTFCSYKPETTTQWNIVT